jgi:hypothetical protein
MMVAEAERLREQGLDVESVSEILEGRRGQPGEPTRVDPPRLPDTPMFPEPGIYFNMPEAEYHAIPALSNSGIKCLASSPMLFWAKSWLNPNKEEIDREHHILGRAYHCRLMEGASAFALRFAVLPDKSEFKDLLVTDEDIRQAIKDAGGWPVSGNKNKRVEQLLDLDPSANVWDIIVGEHAIENGGKAFITAEQWKRLEIAAYMIDRDPELSKAFSGGHPEVSLFWHCPTTGVPMKARVDYLKHRAMIDLKSFGNQRERSIERAIAYEIAGYHYNIQPSVYFEGAAEVRKIVQRHGASAVHGLEDPSWALEWGQHLKPDEWLWVFQQKGPAPVTRGVWYPRAGTTKMVTDEIVAVQKRKFARCVEKFGAEPWLDIEPIYKLADEDIPPFATEI